MVERVEVTAAPSKMPWPSLELRSLCGQREENVWAVDWGEKRIVYSLRDADGRLVIYLFGFFEFEIQCIPLIRPILSNENWPHKRDGLISGGLISGVHCNQSDLACGPKLEAFSRRFIHCLVHVKKSWSNSSYWTVHGFREKTPLKCDAWENYVAALSERPSIYHNYFLLQLSFHFRCLPSQVFD